MRQDEINPRRRLGRRSASIIIGLFLVAIFALASFGPIFHHDLSETLGGSRCGVATPPSPASSSLRRIALIDELATDNPDPSFVESVNSSASAAGYRLDYFPPWSATIQFFADLPTKGYSMVIFRNHGPGVGLSSEPGIATSVPYDQNAWVGDQLNDRLAIMEIGGHLYFAITPRFISDLMCGQFSGTMVLAMFCNSASFYIPLVHAFVDKGAKSFIGWNSSVTVGYDDLSFDKLVPLLLGGSSVAQSVETVMRDLGPDPVYGGHLAFYP
jgi:hypothetical protein